MNRVVPIESVSLYEKQKKIYPRSVQGWFARWRWGEDAVIAMINNGKTSEMPAHAERMSAAQIHVLAAYVWSLSHRGAGATQ